jgi:hypothetical protein
MATKSWAHLNLAIAVFPPIALALLDEALRHQRRSPWRLGVLAGVAVVVQLLITEEVVVLTVIPATVIVLALAIWRWRNDADDFRRRAAYAGRVFGAAFATAAVLFAVPLWVQLAGPHQPRFPLVPRTIYVTDPVNLVVPTRVQWLAPHVARTLSEEHMNSGHISEQTAYIGVPLALLLAFAWKRSRNRLAANVGGGTAVVALVLSLGAFLRILSHRLPIPLPEAPFSALPLVRNVLPARMTVCAFLGMGLLLAAWLDDHARNRRLLPWAVAGLCLVPNLPARIPYRTVETPKFFRTSTAVDTVADRIVLLLPIENPRSVRVRPGGRVEIAREDTLPWQAAADFRFRMTNGYAYTPADATDRAVRSFLQVFATIEAGGLGAERPSADDIARQMCRLRIDAVVAAPMATDEELKLVTDALGSTPRTVVDVRLWDHVPARACHRAP